MNKRNLSVILVLALGIIFQTTFAYAQDSAKSKSSEEFTALKKGNFAFYLEFGTMLFKTSTANYDSGYDFLLTAKYHFSERTALRLTGGVYISDERGINGSYENNSNNYYTYKVNNNYTSFNTTINIQHFLSLKSKVKPFLGFGIYARYNYDLDSYQDLNYKVEEWGIGPYASFGAEFFILDNISIIGEYIIKGTYGKSYRKSYFGSPGILEHGYTYTTDYKLDFQSFRAGLSIYF